MSDIVSTTRDVAVDWTTQYDYGRLVEEEIAEYVQVEVTEELHLGGIHAQHAWRHWFEYLAERVWKTHFTAEIVADGRQPQPAEPRVTGSEGERPATRILSLGCGHGGIELSVAAQLSPPYELIAVDINAQLSAEARKTAGEQGLHIRWEEFDLNFVQLQESTFDVVYAHASLHHLLNLEHIFEQVHRALRPGGRLVILDMIGRSQVLFWPENLEAAVDIVARMPERYRPGLSDPRAVIAPYIKPYVGMEGIRQEEIPALLNRWFDPIRSFTYGSFMRILCTHPVIGTAIDPARSEDRQYLEGLFEQDLRMIREGLLRPTEMFAVLAPKGGGINSR